MLNDAVREFANNLRFFKENHMALPLLYVGERASLSEQNRTWYEEIQLTVLADEDPTINVDQISPAERLERFRQRWTYLPIVKRVTLVDKVMVRLRLSTGYRALASLLEAGYFRLVLTGNLDSLIEDSLIKRSLRSRQYSLLANGSFKSIELLKETLTTSTRPIIILKLLGDFSNHDDTTIARNDIQEYMEPVRTVLAPYLSSLLLVVGAGNFDEEIFPYFKSEGQISRERIYYACSKLPESFYNVFPRRPFQALTEEVVTFDQFFTLLAQLLGVSVQSVTGQLAPTVVESSPVTSPGQLHEERTTPREKQPEQTMPPEELPPPIEKRQPDLSVELEIFTIFNIDIDVHERLSFNVVGQINFKSSESKEWPVDIENWRLQMQDLGEDILLYYQSRSSEVVNRWRRRAKAAGLQLYTEMMNTYRDLEKKFDWACNEAQKPLLTFSFNGPLKDLSIPFELMYYAGQPLAVQYPLCRTVTGIPARHRDNFDTFVRSLRNRGNPLRVLLIASDIDGILNVDEEIANINRLLQERARNIQLKITIDMLQGENATLDTVKTALRGCRYHIVHYAGHGQYNSQSGEDSALFFRTNKRWQDGVGRLTAREMALLMNTSETRLFYMSSCVGANIGSTAQLYNGDYLGMMDALVTAGVPYVLGYRWYVSDVGSITFASKFYEQLFASQFIPEHAVLAARNHIYSASGNDETWASAMLVAQYVYQ